MAEAQEPTAGGGQTYLQSYPPHTQNNNNENFKLQTLAAEWKQGSVGTEQKTFTHKVFISSAGDDRSLVLL